MPLLRDRARRDPADPGQKSADRRPDRRQQDFTDVVSHGFSDDDIWDIAAIAAFFALSNRIANVTAMCPDDEFYMMGRLPK